MYLLSFPKHCSNKKEGWQAGRQSSVSHKDKEEGEEVSEMWKSQSRGGGDCLSRVKVRTNSGLSLGLYKEGGSPSGPESWEAHTGSAWYRGKPRAGQQGRQRANWSTSVEMSKRAHQAHCRTEVRRLLQTRDVGAHLCTELPPPQPRGRLSAPKLLGSWLHSTPPQDGKGLC